MTSPSTPRRAVSERAAQFRKTYILNVALAAYAGSKGDLSDACDTAERAYATLLDRIEELKAALKPFAEAGGSDAVAVSDVPLREKNRQETILWSYEDTRLDKTYRITLLDLRRARAALGGSDG